MSQLTLDAAAEQYAYQEIFLEDDDVETIIQELHKGIITPQVSQEYENYPPDSLLSTFYDIKTTFIKGAEFQSALNALPVLEATC